MDKREVKESGLIQQYILGLTDKKQDAIVEKLMQEDPAIKREILEAQDALFTQAQSYATRAPKGIKKSILRKIDQIEDPEYDNVSLGLGKWLRYAAVGILLVSTFGLLYQNNNLKNENQTLSSTVKDLNDALDASSESNTALVSNEYILTHSATEKVELRGTNLSPEASLTAFYNPKAEVLMIKIQKLPPPPPGKYYHMWADVDGEMLHVGRISTDEVSLTSLNFVAQAESLNVTLEDKEETDHATVDQLALSASL